jgi:hypothetical protein
VQILWPCQLQQQCSEVIYHVLRAKAVLKNSVQVQALLFLFIMFSGQKPYWRILSKSKLYCFFRIPCKTRLKVFAYICVILCIGSLISVECSWMYLYLYLIIKMQNFWSFFSSIYFFRSPPLTTRQWRISSVQTYLYNNPYSYELK